MGREQYDDLSDGVDSTLLGFDDRQENLPKRQSRAMHPFWLTSVSLLLLISLVLNISSTITINRVKDSMISILAPISPHSNPEQAQESLPTLPETDLRAGPPNGIAPMGSEFGGCGNSTEEARALGCIFDPASWLWMQPPCYNARLVSEFLERIDWRFFAAQDLSGEEIPYEEWVRGDHPTVHTKMEYHVNHCTFHWRKIHEAHVGRRPLDSGAAALGHSSHCEMTVLELSDWEYLRTCRLPGNSCTSTLYAGFTTCGWY
ncbi:hypothetical protein MMC25_005741 [Agyrium rufum]|nr:hypothetical protein [Agyrium rufum]